MSDTYNDECKQCGYEADLIQGICQECVCVNEKEYRKKISLAAAKFYWVWYSDQFFKDCERVKLGQLQFTEDRTDVRLRDLRTHRVSKP